MTLMAVSDLVLAVSDDQVKPGWLGFGVVMGLIVLVALLMLSFRKQLRKIDFEESDDANDDER